MHVTRTSARVLVALSLATLALPVSAASLTTEQVGAVVNLLNSFSADQNMVASVRASLLGMPPMGGDDRRPPMGAPGMMQGGSRDQAQGQGEQEGRGRMMGLCPTFKRNLGMGSRGDDVKQLQQMLAQDPTSGFSGTATGVFGPQTMKALMRFQKANNVSSTTSGTIGPKSREFFDRKCGGQGGMQQGQGPMGMMGGVGGTITANTGSSLTIQGMGSTTIMVILSASTTVDVFTGTSTPPTRGSVSDLMVGKMVMVEGPKNADGSVNAQHIKVGVPPRPMPMMQDMRQGGDH